MGVQEGLNKHETCAGAAGYCSRYLEDFQDLGVIEHVCNELLPLHFVVVLRVPHEKVFRVAQQVPAVIWMPGGKSSPRHDPVRVEA